MFRLLICLFSLSAFSCTKSDLDIQRQLFDSLITKYKAEKTKPLKSIRKIDFLPGKRARFLYITSSGEVKNIILSYEIDESCKLSLKSNF